MSYNYNQGSKFFEYRANDTGPDSQIPKIINVFPKLFNQIANS